MGSPKPHARALEETPPLQLSGGALKQPFHTHFRGAVSKLITAQETQGEPDQEEACHCLPLIWAASSTQHLLTQIKFSKGRLANLRQRHGMPREPGPKAIGQMAGMFRSILLVVEVSQRYWNLSFNGTAVGDPTPPELVCIYSGRRGETPPTAISKWDTTQAVRSPTTSVLTSLPKNQNI